VTARVCPGCGLIHPDSAIRCECGANLEGSDALQLAANKLAARDDAATRWITLGGLLVAAGVMYALASWQSGGIGLFIYGPMAAGFAFMFRGWAQRRAVRRLQALLPPEQPPDSTSILGKPELWSKVVGQTCAACESRIVVVVDGDLCATCGVPIHRECARVHAVTHGAPYR